MFIKVNSVIAELKLIKVDLHNEKSIHDDPLDEIRNDREVTESRICV